MRESRAELGRQVGQLRTEEAHIWEMCHCLLDNDAKDSVKHESGILENYTICLIHSFFTL